MHGLDEIDGPLDEVRPPLPRRSRHNQNHVQSCDDAPPEALVLGPVAGRGTRREGLSEVVQRPDESRLRVEPKIRRRHGRVRKGGDAVVCEGEERGEEERSGRQRHSG